MPKESKQAKKERLQAIKRGSEEYNKLSGNDKKAWNAFDRRKFVENNKFISKEKRANIELWNEKISKKLGLEEIKENVDLAIQREGMPDTFNAIDAMTNEKESGIEKQDENFTHLNDFFTEVMAYKALGIELKYGELIGDEAKQQIIQDFAGEGGKVWASYKTEGEFLVVKGLGIYRDGQGYFKELELKDGKMVDVSGEKRKISK